MINERVGEKQPRARAPILLDRSRTRATSSAVRRFFMGPSLAHSTEGLPFQVDQFLGGRPSDFRLAQIFR